MHNKGLIKLGATTNAQLIQAFKDASNWAVASGGVPTYKDFLTAKLKVSKDLNIVNKFMVRRPSSVPDGDFKTADGTALNKGNDPTFEFVCKEIENGEDAEILVGWLNGAGARTSGHYLTVIGCERDPANNKKQIWVQDDERQDKADAKNRRRNTRYTDGAPPKLDDLAKNRVELVLSESPKPKADQLRSLGPTPNSIAVGGAGEITTTTQYNSNAVPRADVVFSKLLGDFTFTSGVITPDGKQATVTTDNAGRAKITFVTNAAGRALVKASVSGTALTAYSFFGIVGP
jgi:hypothetical protein